MTKNLFYFLTAVAFATSALPALAGKTVATVPDGMITLAIKKGATNYLSIPLTKTPIYSGTVSAVTTATIIVDDNPAPFTTSLTNPDSPYFIRLISGNEAGRVMLITSNSIRMLVLDTTDHISGQAVTLTTAGFNVQVGDMFEIFAGDTISSVLGDGSPTHPLLVTGGANPIAADVVSLYTAASIAPTTYFYNTTTSQWQQSNFAANSNNVVIYPYSAFTVVRRATHADTTLTLSGRVTQVAPATKILSKGSVYTSSKFASDIKLSQLQFGGAWVKSASMLTADTISLWNSTLNRFEIFYQKPDSTWRKYPDAFTDQSSVVISAGQVATIGKRAIVSGADTFLQLDLPYSLK